MSLVLLKLPLNIFSTRRLLTGVRRQGLCDTKAGLRKKKGDLALGTSQALYKTYQSIYAPPYSFLLQPFSLYFTLLFFLYLSLTSVKLSPSCYPACRCCSSSMPSLPPPKTMCPDVTLSSDYPSLLAVLESSLCFRVYGSIRAFLCT